MRSLLNIGENVFIDVQCYNVWITHSINQKNWSCDIMWASKVLWAYAHIVLIQPEICNIINSQA